MTGKSDRIHRDAKAVIDRMRERGHDPYEVSVLQELWLSALSSRKINSLLFADNRELRERLAEQGSQTAGACGPARV